jgi:protein-tyrosine phosphatase
MAEAVFMQRVKEAGLTPYISADSAGTGAWHIGKPPHQGTLNILKKYEIKDYHHRARQIQARDLNEFDFVLTMDDANLTDVKREYPKGTAHLAPLLTFAPHIGSTEVPDPYYDGRFEEVYTLVSEATDGLLQHIIEQYDLQKKKPHFSIERYERQEWSFSLSKNIPHTEIYLPNQQRGF